MLHKQTYSNIISSQHYSLDVTIEFLNNDESVSKTSSKLEDTILDSVVKHNFSVEQLMYLNTYISILAKDIQENSKDITLYSITVTLTKKINSKDKISKQNTYKLQ